MPVTDVEFNPSADPVVTAIKEQGVALENFITTHVPNGRRRSIALTNLETALMYAVKARVRGDD